MLETIGSAVFGFFVIAILISMITDAAWLSAWILQPVVRLFQRVVLGIDRVRAGPETLIGAEVKIQDRFAWNPETGMSEGFLFVGGERWQSRSAEPVESLEPGERVRVLSRDGVVLEVTTPAKWQQHR